MINDINKKIQEFIDKISPDPMTEIDIRKSMFINETLGYAGKMISASKKNYNGKCVFNANLCTKSTKLWFGDIDLEKDTVKLQKIADELKENIYVLKEMDGRFENEKKPLIENAVLVIKPN